MIADGRWTTEVSKINLADAPAFDETGQRIFRDTGLARKRQFADIADGMQLMGFHASHGILA